MKTYTLLLSAFFLLACSKQEPESPMPTPQAPVSYTITISAGAGGNVSSSGGSYEAGTQLNITATPDGEYVFSGWSNGSTENPLTLTVNSNTTLTATFVKRRYPLSIYTQGQGTVSETLVNAGKTPTEYSSGSVVRLTASASDGWEFSAWSGVISSTQNPIEISINEAKTVTATFNEINSVTTTTTGNTFNQDNAPSYIDVNGQGEFTITITAEKDGLIDITILPLESENSYWDFYESSDPELNIASKITQTIQSNFSDIDPNSTDLITINYINRPRKYQIEGTNLWVYDGNSDFGPVSPSESQMRNIWNSCVSAAASSSIIQVYQSQQENLKSTIWPQAYQNIYANGYALYDSTVGIIIFPDTPAPTLFHEYAHGFDANFLNETDRAIVQQSFDTARTQWQTQFGYVPGFTNTCDANGQNCAPYQLYNVAEFFAVLSTAYHGFANGSEPTGLSTASPLQSADDVLTYYPNVHALFVNLYGNPPSSGSTATSDTTTTSSTTASSTTSSSTSDTSSDSPTYTTILEPFANPDSGYGNFTKKVVVFDVPIYGTNQVDDAKIRHAANVMAEYLDNDEDGQPDNTLVVEALKDNHGFLLVWKNESDLNIFDSLEHADAGQDLGADETIPVWHTNGNQGQFDASLEEVLHLITHIGYHNAYPDVFGEVVGSSVGDAMDIARGGQFTSIPASYPAGAWYTYDDDSCDYACQVTEYVFWALTSILGAHENRLGEIDNEWTLNTPAKVQQTDTAIYALLTDPQYHFPTILPDGVYNGQSAD